VPDDSERSGCDCVSGLSDGQQNAWK
jgi:hypothetical protein